MIFLHQPFLCEFIYISLIFVHRQEAPDFKKFLQGALDHDDEDYDCMYPQGSCPFQGKKLLNHVSIGNILL